MPTPQQIAAWRLEQLLPLLDPTLSRDERRAAMRRITRTGVHWPAARGLPSAKRRPIRRSTLRRWLKLYRSGGLKALEPKLRSDFGSIRRDDAEPWIQKAIQFLYERHTRSLTQIEEYLGLEFPDYDLGRATLHRHLQRHPAYQGILALKRRRPRKLRDSYETKRPHECWQLDGKGKFSVTLRGGAVIHMRVLTVIDDFSRAVLAAIVAPEEDTKAAIRVFRMAVERYGLADRFQFDRGSAFDSEAFRGGLAMCGIHRNRVKPRNPEAQGKVEAYHRCLGRWFIDELEAQEVVDVGHLQQLLEAMLGVFYNRHHHRELRMTPEQKLGGRVSDRRIAPQDLHRAFFVEVTKSSHPKTGEVRLPNGNFRVPLPFAGKRCQILFDPVTEGRAILVRRGHDDISLEVFAQKPLPPAVIESTSKCGVGQLQKLLDVWQGKKRPIAQPGFGLPEVYDAIGRMVGRNLPATEREATQIVDFYKLYGPLAREGFMNACEKSSRALGPGRPISAYLADLERQIVFSRNHRSNNNKECDA